jgi:hypothetical protein
MEERIGQVTHFYNRIRVAVLDLSAELKVGDVVHLTGRTTDFTQSVESIEIEHQNVQAVGPGQEAALKVIDRVRKGDVVFKVIEE